MKNKKYCPLCMAKKIIGKTKVSQVAKGAYGNGVAMTFADTVLNMFMGKIYISTLYDNARAVRFWDKVCANYETEEAGVEDKKHWVIVK